MSSDLFSPLPEPAADPFAAGTDSSRTLGVVALIIGAVIVVAATVTSAIAGYPVGVAAGRAFAEAPVGSGVDPTWLAPLQGWVAVVEIAFWAGTIGGMWALIQGIIAIAQNRGRVPGIAAAVIAVAGPVLFTVAGTMTMIAGYATASGMPVG
ncbi:hypothetical protein ET475_13450 [Microbacterium protaetiae]|uniref:Uncharacterized protein n=1 Tax=Microbacterium protaetiae TaxID=2509458 RepID=A0A4P6EHB5_9MICO|nr:hypothetical protein [Microbacterium protaetiae]QAY60893.1 hypothetical protein ET475_13450 [Microbacterium protaetiae]